MEKKRVYAVAYGVISVPMWLFAVFGAVFDRGFLSLWRESASSFWIAGSDPDRFLSDAGALFEFEHYLFHLSPFLLVAIALWGASRARPWVWPAFTIAAIAIASVVPWSLHIDGFGQLFLVSAGFAADVFGWRRGIRVLNGLDQTPS